MENVTSFQGHGEDKRLSKTGWILGGLAIVIFGIVAPVILYNKLLPFNDSQSSISDGLPTIDSVYPSISSVGDTLTIKGNDFDAGINNSHTLVRIKNTVDSAILWSGSPTSTKGAISPNQIKVVLPQKVCRSPEPIGSSCPSGGYMDILPGQYILNVEVEGRGISNEMILNVQVETL